MAKQEITLRGLDGHEDHLVYDAADGQMGGSLEECAKSLFPQEGETTPRLRFQGFEGEWEKAKASDLFVTFNERNRPDLPVLSACQDIRGMAVRSESGYDISHDRSNEVTYKVVRPGQFVIHLRSFQGGFAHSAVEGITSPAYTVFGFKNPERHDDYFWKIIFMSKSFVKRLETITYGIRDGRSISFEEFSNMDFLFPSHEEQKAIASFFHRLDVQIALRKNQYERLQQVKSACLESMFPRGTEIAPPIRFKGYDGEWIKSRFSDMTERISQYTKSDKYPSVEFEDIVSGEGILNKDVRTKGAVKNGIIFHKNDVLFGKLRPYLKNILFADFDGVAVGDFWVLRSLGIDPYFLYILVNSGQFMDVANISSGSKMPRADWKLVSNTFFLVPPTLNEQKSIAAYFKELNLQINTEQVRLDKLKQMKSACLRSMFPQNGGG